MLGGVTSSSAPPSSKTWLLHRAQLVARLRHPNLVRMLPLPGGAGLTPVPGNARRLADFIVPTQTFRRFELPQVLCLLLDVLSGLSALHELKLDDGDPFVHGDVSPQHIYVDEHGTGRLVPLVSAHLMPKARLESTGYLAPERLLGDRVDERADVYSVGVMLWEALAGRQLFPNTSPDAVLAHAISGRIPPLDRAGREAWTRPLCAIAERAIATDPAQRFGSALELSSAIAQASRLKLSQLREDSWQDEAPTPVFMPRVHLVPPTRSATPPATVVELAPEAPILTYEEVQERVRRPRAALLGLASVVVAALGWLVPQVARLGSVPMATGAAPVQAPAAAAAPLPAPPVVNVSASASPSAAAVVSAAPAPSSSAVPAASAAPHPARALKPRPRAPRPAARTEADYGI